MFSVKVPKQFEASQGWEWQPDPNPAGHVAPPKRACQTRLDPVSSTRGALTRSKVSGVAGVGITLLAVGWFVLPAVAARQWDAPRFPAAMPEVLAWNGARNSHTSPQAVLIELAQREGSDGAVVPPVKRQAPQMPDAKSAPAAAPESTTETPASPQANPTTAQQTPAPAGAPVPETAPEGGSWFDWNRMTSRISDWLAKANREYQGTIVKELSKPGPGDAEAARLAADKAAREQAARAEAERAQAEQARLAAAEAEARRKAEAEAQAKAAVEAQKPAEAAKQADAAAEQKATPQQPDKDAQEAEAAKLREAARTAEERQAQRLKEEQAQRAQAETERKAREAKAEQERKARALSEAQAKLKAAEVERKRRLAEAAPAAREAPEPVLRHRKWAVTIIPEPIGRPEARARNDGGAVLVGARRLNGRMSLGAGSVRSGTAVKRWVMRDTSCRYAGQKRKRRYVVARGDNLWRISQKYYHRGSKYPRIYKANRDRIADPDLIYPCQRFRVPKR